MTKTIRRPRKAAADQNLCVACGACVKVCRFDAIHIEQGVFALVDHARCVGCGLCVKTCPASVMTIAEVDVK